MRQRIHCDTRTTEVNMAEMDGTGDSIEEAYLSLPCTRHVDRKRRRIHGDTRTTEVNMAEMDGTGDYIEEAYLSLPCT